MEIKIGDAVEANRGWDRGIVVAVDWKSHRMLIRIKGRGKHWFQIAQLTVVKGKVA